MSSVTNPLYRTTSNNFVLEFYKDSEIEQLSLATAKKYFVGLVGINILRGYYYFRNTINCDDQIVGVDLIANDNIVANQLTTNKVVSQNIQANKIICDELVLTKQQIIPSTIYGYIYSDGMSLPIIGSEADLSSFFVPIKKLVQILLLPNTKIIFYPTNSLLPKKLIQNKETRCKLFVVDLNRYDRYDLYFNDELKQ
jgi:hypothetical protein